MRDTACRCFLRVRSEVFGTCSAFRLQTELRLESARLTLYAAFAACFVVFPPWFARNFAFFLCGSPFLSGSLVKITFITLVWTRLSFIRPHGTEDALCIVTIGLLSSGTIQKTVVYACATSLSCSFTMWTSNARHVAVGIRLIEANITLRAVSVR